MYESKERILCSIILARLLCQIWITIKSLAGASRGVSCEAVFSPSFSSTSILPTFGATQKMLKSEKSQRHTYLEVLCSRLKPQEGLNEHSPFNHKNREFGDLGSI